MSESEEAAAQTELVAVAGDLGTLAEYLSGIRGTNPSLWTARRRAKSLDPLGEIESPASRFPP